MNKLSLVVATLIVLLGSGSVVSMLDLPGLLDNVLAWFTVAIAQVVGTLLVAGVALEAFRPAVVLALELGVSAACTVLAVRHDRRRRLSGLPPWTQSWRPGLREVVTVARSPWAMILALAALVEAIWSAAIAWLMPPYGWDALVYHLPTIATWMQTERIGHISYMYFSDAFPGNAWLVYAWPGLFLGNDVLVDVGQLVFAIAGALACAGLVRTIGGSRAGAVAGGSLFFLAPIVLQQLTVDYVDVAVASVFVVALHFLARFLRDGCGFDLRSQGRRGN